MKQTNIGSWWGAFMMLLSRVAGYATFMILGMNIILSYPLISGWIKEVIGWDFPMLGFIATIAFLLMIAMIVEYRFSIAAIQTFSNSQWYKHKNPMREFLEERDKICNEKFNAILDILERDKK
jgi:hypothetical protein